MTNTQSTQTRIENVKVGDTVILKSERAIISKVEDRDGVIWLTYPAVAPWGETVGNIVGRKGEVLKVATADEAAAEEPTPEPFAKGEKFRVSIGGRTVTATVTTAADENGAMEIRYRLDGRTQYLPLNIADLEG